MPRAGRPCASESEGRGLSEDCPKQPELVRGPVLHRSVTFTFGKTFLPRAIVVLLPISINLVQIWWCKDWFTGIHDVK